MAKYDAKKHILKEIREDREVRIDAYNGVKEDVKSDELTTQEDLPVERYIWNVWQVVTGRSRDEVLDTATLDAIRDAVEKMQKEIQLNIQEAQEEYVDDSQIYKTVKVSDDEYDESELPTVYVPKEKTREEIQRMVRAASYLLPEKSNLYMDDSMRLIRYFQDYDLRTFVERIMEYPHAKPIMYRDRAKSNKLRKYILEKFNAKWNNLNMENKIAVISLLSLNKEQFDQVYQVMLINSEDMENVVPLDLVNNMTKRNRIYPKSNSKKKTRNTRREQKRGDSYTAGRAEEDTLFSPQMEADIPASEMIYAGYEKKVVIDFHARAPRGYWDTVVDLLKDPRYNGDVELIYDDIEKKFSFHPFDQMKPPK